MADDVVVGMVKDIASVWPGVKALLSEAVTRDGSTMTLDALADELLSGRKQLWVGASGARGIEAVLVTEIIQHSAVRALVMVLCIGVDRGRWLSHLDAVVAFARENHCGILRALSRPGWRRDLAKIGFRHRHDILEMAL